MAKTFSLSYPCGCAFVHNTNSSSNIVITLCGPTSPGKDHNKNETVRALAQQVSLKLAEFEKVTGN